MKETYREMERGRRISEIVQTLIKLDEAGTTYDEKLFVIQICSRYGVTERKAKEYIKLAEWKKNNIA